MSDLTLRYAADDNDVIAIHGFLCAVAGPTLPGPIGAAPSIQEIWRVVNNDCALMAMRGDFLVGSFGIIKPKFWWSDDLHFLANRWLFTLPGLGAGRFLLDEAIKIAKASELELHVYDEARGRLKIFNRSPRRSQAPALHLPVLVAPPRETAPTLQ